MVGCLLLSATVVVGPKPPDKPGKPGEGPKPTGTIFFQYYDGTETAVWTMNPDGSDKTKVTLVTDGVDSLSQIKHGDHYWYIDFCVIEGEYYPDDLPRREIFAVRDDHGVDPVQLTDDPTLAIDHRREAPIWGHDDSYVTWPAMKWVYDGETWYVDENQAGIFNAALTHYSNGDISGANEPTLVWNSGVKVDYDGYTVPTTGNLADWSPDGTKIVRYKSGVNVLDLDPGLENPTETVIAEGWPSDWSPDGNKIAFTSYNRDLRIINPDGSNEQIIAQGRDSNRVSQEIWNAKWSFDNKFLTYKLAETNFAKLTHKWWIYRIDADGDHKTSLTNDLPADVYKHTVGWR